MSGAALQEAAGERGRARLPPRDLYADYVLSDHPTTQIALSRPTTLSDHPPPSGWTIRPPSATNQVPRCAACAMLARHHLLIAAAAGSVKGVSKPL